MSQMRRPGIFDRSGDRKSAIKTLTRDYPAGHVIPLHFHDRNQLVYASRGVMTVRTRNGTWVVPPHRAVWIPVGVPHIVTMSASVEMRTLYLKPRLVRGLSRDCCVINVPALLEELVLYACTFRTLRKSVQWRGAPARKMRRRPHYPQHFSLRQSARLCQCRISSKKLVGLDSMEK